MSNRELAHRLGLERGHLSRILSGRLQLKVVHMLKWSTALGLEPYELFHLAYPPEPPAEPPGDPYGPLLRRGAAAPGPLSAYSCFAGMTDEEIDRRIEEKVLQLLRKMGVIVDRDEPEKGGS